MYILVYVDGILLTSNDSFMVSHIIVQLNQEFALKDLGTLHYLLGFEVFRNHTNLHLSQTKHAKDLLSKAHIF